MLLAGDTRASPEGFKWKCKSKEKLSEQKMYQANKSGPDMGTPEGRGSGFSGNHSKVGLDNPPSPEEGGQGRKRTSGVNTRVWGGEEQSYNRGLPIGLMQAKYRSYTQDNTKASDC